MTPPTGRPVVRIATRSSELAMRQARLVADALAARGVEAALVAYETTGDRRLDQPLRAIGAKGLFTRELEDDLLAGRVDCAVHSLKDLPTDSLPRLAVVALLPRDDPRDALVVRHGLGVRSLAELPAGTRVGTSSLRRRAQLLAACPHVDVRELRGNVPTRLRKVDAGEVDAAILAVAGLVRLDAAERIAARLGPPDWLWAAGQGAIAVQARAEDAPMRALLAALDDAATSRAAGAERALLAALGGGCQVPVGVALVEQGGRRVLHALVAAPDGSTIVRGQRTLPGDRDEPDARALARDMLTRGAGEILARARDLDPVPSPQPE